MNTAYLYPVCVVCGAKVVFCMSSKKGTLPPLEVIPPSKVYTFWTLLEILKVTALSKAPAI